VTCIAALYDGKILISGDFIRDVPRSRDMAPHIAATAAFVSELRRIAPVVGVQGHVSPATGALGRNL